MSPRVVSVYPETGHRATRKDCVVPDCSGKLSPPSLRRAGVTIEIVYRGLLSLFQKKNSEQNSTYIIFMYCCCNVVTIFFYIFYFTLLVFEIVSDFAMHHESDIGA